MLRTPIDARSVFKSKGGKAMIRKIVLALAFLLPLAAAVVPAAVAQGYHHCHDLHDLHCH